MMCFLLTMQSIYAISSNKYIQAFSEGLLRYSLYCAGGRLVATVTIERHKLEICGKAFVLKTRSFLGSNNRVKSDVSRNEKDGQNGVKNNNKPTAVHLTINCFEEPWKHGKKVNSRLRSQGYIT